jgi:hypothetical protein
MRVVNCSLWVRKRIWQVSNHVLCGKSSLITRKLAELGESGKKIEELEDKDIKHLTDRKVFHHLALNKNKTPLEPLLSGEWA